MAKKEAERLLIDGGASREMRLKYDTLEPKSAFVATANEEGYDFTESEFDEVLRESGDDFASFGNPRKRAIWWF
ncbi:Nif11-like leader peptide family natural product precursor [Pontiellaceae bacterium B1224]|nr:Nif11-like leader peptide family natural product precursor [Pontiellaceae bacterium B1224]